MTSRVAFISAKAKNPNAAKLFLDYLLSKRGQTIIANQAELYSLRDDVDGEATVKKVAELIGDKARRFRSATRCCPTSTRRNGSPSSSSGRRRSRASDCHRPQKRAIRYPQSCMDSLSCHKLILGGY